MNRGVVLSIALSSAVALAAACGNGGSPSNPTPPGGGGTQSPTDSSLTAPTLQAPTVGEAVKNLQPELQIGNASGGSGTRNLYLRACSGLLFSADRRQ